MCGCCNFRRAVIFHPEAVGPFICKTSKDCQLSSCRDRNHDDFDDDDDDGDDDEASRVTIPDKLGMCRNGNV